MHDTTNRTRIKTSSIGNALGRVFWMLFTCIAALGVMQGNGRTQVLYVCQAGNPTVSEYSATTGALINANFITGLYCDGLLASGNNLFVSGEFSNYIAEYNLSTGAPISAAFIGPLSNPAGLAVTGNDFFVANMGNGTIGKYNATTGAPIQPSLVTGLRTPWGTVLPANNTLLATSYDVIGKYKASTGAAINANFITGVQDAIGLVLSGADLFVANANANTVAKYKASTGAAINVQFISADTLQEPSGLAISGNPDNGFLCWQREEWQEGNIGFDGIELIGG
ncbi:MAG: hypothetical protein JO189_07260 [Deltaproteobacteria bacterium]|nr:hypothetical protein [Deltaproteobacteria bacterium]